MVESSEINVWIQQQRGSKNILLKAVQQIIIWVPDAHN